MCDGKCLAIFGLVFAVKTNIINTHICILRGHTNITLKKISKFSAVKKAVIYSKTKCCVGGMS